MTLDELLAISTKDDRICPQPMAWDKVWKMLPNRRQTSSGWEPPAPLILTAWWHASDSEKRQRFQLHLRWAHEHGAAARVADLLLSLKTGDWYTGQ